MIYPAISDLMKKVDSRYSLVVATAKRARELVSGAEPLVKTQTNKPVSVAVAEIYSDKIKMKGASQIKPSKEDESNA